MSSDIPVSDADVEKLVSSLNVDVSSASADPALAGISFCQAWPVVKSVLETVGKQIPFPGNLAISAVILIGDALHKDKCA